MKNMLYHTSALNLLPKVFFGVWVVFFSYQTVAPVLKHANFECLGVVDSNDAENKQQVKDFIISNAPLQNIPSLVASHLFADLQQHNTHHFIQIPSPPPDFVC